MALLSPQAYIGILVSSQFRPVHQSSFNSTLYSVHMENDVKYATVQSVFLNYSYMVSRRISCNCVFSRGSRGRCGKTWPPSIWCCRLSLPASIFPPSFRQTIAQASATSCWTVCAHRGRVPAYRSRKQWILVYKHSLLTPAFGVVNFRVPNDKKKYMLLFRARGGIVA
jgi:hypothetical protein